MRKIVGALGALVAMVLLLSAYAPPAEAGNGNSSSQYIAPNAGTAIPIYDTAWQLFSQATVGEADEYFDALEENGFTGAWVGVIHHAPARYLDDYEGGGQIGNLTASGDVVLNPGYIAHVRSILDRADDHDMKVGLVVAWQNLYLPGGQSDTGLAISDQVRGTIDTSNAYAYGQQMVEAFGDHPAVSMWITGGDAGSNNTDANIAVWRVMVDGIRDAGSTLDVTHHLPSDYFDHFNYVDEPWLDFISPETGHIQGADQTETELRAVEEAYNLPVWQGEARYFNISYDWIPDDANNPGVAEIREDAIAARNAGVAGYVYGDAGRWHWCQPFGDSTPCDPANIADSFGAGEAATVEVFAGLPATEPAPQLCLGREATVSGLIGTAGDDVIVGTSGDDRIVGGGGDDLICALQGADTIDAGTGDDIVYGGWGPDVIRAGYGNDEVYGGRGFDNIDGGYGNDELQGSYGNDRIVGNVGRDRIFGGAGSDNIEGNVGYDTGFGGTGNDRIVGNSGNDQLYGGTGNDNIFGNRGDDRIFGGANDDTLSGGFGNDAATGGAGIDACLTSESAVSCE